MQYLIEAKDGWNTVVSAHNELAAIVKVQAAHDKYNHTLTVLAVYEITTR